MDAAHMSTIPSPVKNDPTLTTMENRFRGPRIRLKRKGNRRNRPAIFESNLSPWESANTISLDIVVGEIFL